MGEMPNYVKIVGRGKFEITDAYGDVYLLEEIDGIEDERLRRIATVGDKFDAQKYVDLLIGSMVKKVRTKDGEEKELGSADVKKLPLTTLLRFKLFISNVIMGDYFLQEDLQKKTE